MKLSIIALICSDLFLSIAFSMDIPPFAPRLVNSTFRIEGVNAEAKTTIGTCFLLTQQMRHNTNAGWNVLVTANHVLSDIAGDEAHLFLRLAQTNGSYSRLDWGIRIRENGKPKWYRHPEADVAAMIVSLPQEFSKQHDWIASEFLAGDEVFREREITVGDELMCLGYPLGLESSSSGFPILRSGRIASFPIAPSTVAKTFLFDIPIYGGNSGGPVFFDYRKRRIPGEDSMKWTDSVGIAGIISQDVSQVVKMEGYFETITRRDPLGLAIVIPAEFIKQTVSDLVKQQEPNVQSDGAGNSHRAGQ
ncbi:MAG TPA: serine protease [Candidatus Paceibacterota bacterium]|nr:serine protease [Candidatus Paceibacterota bacterium]